LQAKLVSKAYKELSEDERKKYDDKAEEDKQRYKKEMEGYTPPEGLEASSPKKGGKKKKDKDAPKGASSAYMHFAKAKRAQIKEENPEATFGGLGKLIGEAWKEVTDEEKKKYEDMATADKERYGKEMGAYKKKKKDEAAAKANDSSDDEDSSADSDDSDSDDSD